MIPMFQPDPSGLASISDRVRGCITLVITIASLTAANYAVDNQWLAFFMINGMLNFLVTIGIVFKET
ncbi:MAG: hypothetical protein SGJ27_09220 [Candidatus Melainabacteria bacterium]|nr:hypothetical protein [Candidatus Melainabacteria bacterium]